MVYWVKDLVLSLRQPGVDTWVSGVGLDSGIAAYVLAALPCISGLGTYISCGCGQKREREKI